MTEDALFMGRYPTRTRVRSDLVSTLLAGRREGKTTRLVEWLLQGEQIEPWPGWSRVLVVATADRIDPIRDNFRAADQELREKGCAGGLGKVVLSAGSYALHRLRLSDVEVAVDSAEDLITQQLGFRPDVVSMTGAPFGADMTYAPRKDAKGVLHLWYPVDRQWGHVGRKIGPCADQECPDFGRDSAARHRLEER
jgi:hypothetical protein